MPVHAFLKGGHAVLMVQKHEKSPFLADVRQPPEGHCDRSLARSAWNSATPRNRPVGYGLIRTGVRTSVRRLKYWSDEVSEVRTEEFWMFRKRSIISNISSNIIGRFVPGYDRCCPTDALFDEKDLRD